MCLFMIVDKKNNVAENQQSAVCTPHFTYTNDLNIIFLSNNPTNNNSHYTYFLYCLFFALSLFLKKNFE